MIFLLGLILAILLCLVTFVQTLYLESLRLIPRERPALEFFKESLEQRLHMDTEPGALAFSLLKHTLLVLTGAFVTAAVSAADYPAWRSALEGFGVAWIIMLFSAYALPQMIYRRSNGHWLLPLVPFLKALALLFRPLAALFSFLGSVYELGNVATREEKDTNQVEEIEALITAGEEEGIIEEGDRKLIHSVVAFGDKRVREVMAPRRNIVAIDADRSLDDLRKLVINEQYSRIPVFEGTIDRIVGFVHVRDMFELDPSQRESRKVRDIMRPIEAVPESKPVSELLNEMRTAGSHIVYVVDEYGNTAGLATLEDLVEEILGEIRDEHEPSEDIEKAPDGSIIVAGSLDLDHLADFFGFHPTSDTEATTVGGLVTEWLGEVPKPGERVEREGICIDVLAANDLRVEQVRIRPSNSSRTHEEQRS